MTTAIDIAPIRTMNEPDRAITYPTAVPSSLSEDAQYVYAWGSDPEVSGRRDIKYDLFDPEQRKRSRHWFAAEDDEYEPSQRILDAIAELEAEHLARYSPEYGHNLQVTRVSKGYTVAKGRGSSLIEVYLTDRPGDHRRDGVLLAVLVGGDIESRDTTGNGVTQWTLRARHETATDFEHDAASTALLTVMNPSVPTFAGYGQMTFHAVLTEAHLYPLGTDPLTAEDGDTHAGECDGLDYHSKEQTHEAHPFAPYLPPEVKLSGPRFVAVETYPLRPYLVAADQLV